jgi:ribose-phosphate pyrophosphokinase
MAYEKLRILTGTANPALAQAIACCLDIEVGSMLVSRFSDGEVRVKIQESVRGMDVFVVQPTCSPVNDNVMELLIILDALRRASVRRINVVIPYYGYARQDKKVKPREPVAAKLVADLITQAGANRIVAIDLHAGQIQGFFNIPVDHLFAAPVIVDYLIKLGIYDKDVVVVSPDVGGVARAQALAEMLDSSLAIIPKRRPEPNKSEIIQTGRSPVIGDVSGRIAVIIDDMIDTGGSICDGAEALVRMGAQKVYACCTHPVLSGNACDRLEQAPIEAVVVTDTIPLPPDKRREKFTVLSVAPLLADAIDRIHRDASVSELFLPYF